MVFSGKRESSASHLRRKIGHALEELGWLDSGPQLIHLGCDLLSQSSVAWVLLAQVAQVSSPSHFARMCPISWHLLHLIGSLRSFRISTLLLAIKIRSRRRELANTGSVQITFKFAVVWFGERRSGALTQLADWIVPVDKL